MYEIIHKHKKVSIIIMGIVGISLLLWLFLQSDSLNFARGGKCVVEVDGSCVTLKEYRREILKYSNLLNNKEMENIIKQQVIENLIVQNLLYQKAKDLGLLASDEEVIQTIKSDPTFQENGIFSSYRYKETLSSNGLEPREYEEYVRKILSIQKLLAFIQNGVYMTAEEIGINQTINSVELAGKLYLLNVEDIKDPIELTEKELMEYYEKNKERFKKDQKRSFKLWVTEGDKNKASDIYNSLKAGKDVPGFTLYTLPDDASKLNAQIVNIANSLSERDPVTITKIDGDYYVISLQNVEKSGYRDFNEVKKDLEAEVINLKKSQLLSSKAQDLAKALKKGESINARYVVFDYTPIFRIVNFIKLEQSDAVKLAFSKEKVFGPYSMGQGYAVLYIESRREKKDKDALLDNDLLNLKANAVINLYINHLLKTAKVRINNEML